MLCSPRPVIALVVIALLAVGCASSRLAGEAEEFAAAGNHRLASDRALQSLEEEPGYTRAILLLSSSAPHVVRDELGQSRTETDAQQYDAALRRLKQLNTFASKVQRHGVRVDANAITSQRSVTNQAAARHFYDEAEDLRSRDQLAQAIQQYERAESYISAFEAGPQRRAEANYELATRAESRDDLEEAAQRYEAAFNAVHEYRDSREGIAAMHYRIAREDLEANQYRRAVERFDRVQQWVPDYRDTAYLSADAMEKAIIRVALMPLQNRTGSGIPGISFEDLLYDTTLRRIGQQASQFLQIVDRDSLDVILAEHGFSESTHFDAGTLPPGRLAGVTYLVTGRITQLTARESGPTHRDIRQSYSVPIYREVSKKSKDGVTFKTFEQVGSANAVAHYTDVSASSELTIKGSVKLIDVRTGRIVETKPFSYRKTDSAHYAENLRRKAPYGASDRDVEKRFPSEIRALSKGKRSIKSLSSLADSAAAGISASITATVIGQLDKSTANVPRTRPRRAVSVSSTPTTSNIPSPSVPGEVVKFEFRVGGRGHDAGTGHWIPLVLEDGSELFRGEKRRSATVFEIRSRGIRAVRYDYRSDKQPDIWFYDPDTRETILVHDALATDLESALQGALTAAGIRDPGFELTSTSLIHLRKGKIRRLIDVGSITKGR